MQVDPLDRETDEWTKYSFAGLTVAIAEDEKKASFMRMD